MDPLWLVQLVLNRRLRDRVRNTTRSFPLAPVLVLDPLALVVVRRVLRLGLRRYHVDVLSLSVSSSKKESASWLCHRIGDPRVTLRIELVSKFT